MGIWSKLVENGLTIFWGWEGKSGRNWSKMVEQYSRGWGDMVEIGRKWLNNSIVVEQLETFGYSSIGDETDQLDAICG